MFLKKKKVLALAMAVIGSFALLAAGCGDSGSSGQKSSSNIMQSIKDRGVVKVGVKEDVPLFGYKNPQTGKLEGLEIDLAHQMAKKILGDENKVEFTPVTAKTRGPLLDSGELDFIVATYTINEERKKQYDFTIPYYKDPVGLLVKKSDGINSLADLNGKTVAVPQGATTKKVLEEAAKKAGITLKFSEFATYAECKAALMSGRAQAYGMDTSNLAGYVDNDTQVLNDKFAPQEYGIASKKGNDDLAKILNDTVKELQTSGELDKMLAKWKLAK